MLPATEILFFDSLFFRGRERRNIHNYHPAMYAASSYTPGVLSCAVQAYLHGCQGARELDFYATYAIVAYGTCGVTWCVFGRALRECRLRTPERLVNSTRRFVQSRARGPRSAVCVVRNALYNTIAYETHVIYPVVVLRRRYVTNVTALAVSGGGALPWEPAPAGRH